MPNIMELAATFFEDVAKDKDKKHGHSGSGHKDHKDGKPKDGEKRHTGIRHNVTSPLHLQVINTPQMRKMAENLFTAAIGEDDDDNDSSHKPHSAFAKYLLELDALLRKYGAKPGQSSAIGETPGAENTETKAVTEDDTKWSA